jgi:hypothetical protein
MNKCLLGFVLKGYFVIIALLTGSIMPRQTVGKVSSDLLIKQVDDKHSAHEQMQEQLTDFEKEFFTCVQTHQKIFPIDFYIVVITKRERLMPNVFRNYFTARLSCPTPDYDQSVYHFKPPDRIHYLWTIPDKHSCEFFRAYPFDVPSEERDLLENVLDFYNGELLRKAKKLNGEELASPLLAERK